MSTLHPEWLCNQSLHQCHAEPVNQNREPPDGEDERGQESRLVVLDVLNREATFQRAAGHQHSLTGQQHDQPLMAAAPERVGRPLCDRSPGPSTCNRLSPQCNPTQLSPVSRGRPVITPS
ncbi:unnamed protein product [Pleuronectes platessa]|uniref:Uncharacterized protein n=1 Tax=Pleuronectes platessa TaxID=8262 RepID=A0A9N7ZF52_PLEPL|nr:unnamed protein product [Pleuronectes platessa]